MPLPCPAIYHSEAMKPYREWMTPMHLEVMGSLGGSFESTNIVDYYMDPVEIGYGQFIDFSKDFIGKEALAQKIKNPKRKKVTLVWNENDVMQVMRDSIYPGESPAKFMNLPLAVYSTFQYDSVVKDGKHVGISQYVGYSANARSMLSLSIVKTASCSIATRLSCFVTSDAGWLCAAEHPARDGRAECPSTW
jgi:vanillate/3-O-methylgallate O-demethylase